VSEILFTTSEDLQVREAEVTMTTGHVQGRRMRYPELETRYELHETLGSGGFAKVKAAVHKLTGERVC
jgi:hypothetical protein